MNSKVVLMWFRRDLRLQDNAALCYALQSGLPVLPLFIFDKQILDKLEDKKDARVQFIHQTLQDLKLELQHKQSDLLVAYGNPMEVWPQLFEQYDIVQIFANEDYEPYARERDEQVKALAASKGASLLTFKDQCIFNHSEVLKDDGKPYTVFTPYSRKWKAKLLGIDTFKALPQPLPAMPALQPYDCESRSDAFFKVGSLPMPSLAQMGFEENTHLRYPSKESRLSIIKNYKAQRDFPAIEGTSRLGLHFRFGTISVREKAAKAIAISETYLNELIWREFYMQILWHFPHVAKQAFKPAYDRIAWRNDAAEFEKWCKGQTGYPIVDAGMRELNATGFMHNRVRMIVASFLTKHLLIDWRWGEAYFAKKLLDFDLSANNGGWQWAAGSGTDAAPYFRVFNPALQSAKFDPKGEYIRKWVPEIGSGNYPKPMVVHEYARNRCLETYKAALAEQVV
jgi:deoxyribodipyrimidine photo-lyase